MVSNLRRLTASALVNCNVNEYSARFHLLEIFLLEKFRSCFSRNQHRTDYKVSFLNCFLYISICRNQCLDTCSEDVVKVSQPRNADIHNRYVSAHAYSDLTCVRSNITAAEDYDISLRSSRNACKENALSAGHARAILGAPTAALQKEAAARVVKEQLSVRQTEALIKSLQKEKKERPQTQGPDLSLYLGELEKDLAGRLGRKVKIAHKGKKGRIELEYYSDQDLEALLALLRRLNGEGGVPLV